MPIHTRPQTCNFTSHFVSTRAPACVLGHLGSAVRIPLISELSHGLSVCNIVSQIPYLFFELRAFLNTVSLANPDIPPPVHVPRMVACHS